MSVLLTGGLHAKTSVHIGSLLRRASIPFALATQHGPRSLTPTRTEFSHAPLPAVNFDYEDFSTWEAIFSAPPGRAPIAAVWLLIPEVDDAEAAMEHFVDYCVDRGARRFVLCADTTTKIDHSVAGKTWRMLVDRGVEYVVLRPTWYMGASSPSENKQANCRRGLSANPPAYFNRQLFAWLPPSDHQVGEQNLHLCQEWPMPASCRRGRRCVGLPRIDRRPRAEYRLEGPGTGPAVPH